METAASGRLCLKELVATIDHFCRGIEWRILWRYWNRLSRLGTRMCRMDENSFFKLFDMKVNTSTSEWSCFCRVTCDMSDGEWTMVNVFHYNRSTKRNRFPKSESFGEQSHYAGAAGTPASLDLVD